MSDLKISPLVSTDWFAGRLGDTSLRILDASYFLPTEGTTGAEHYAKQHIRGALFFDIDGIADPANPLPHMLPAPEIFEETARALGVDNDTHVIVYDANPGFSAPRAWFTWRYYGHSRVSVLDGGLKKWLAEGRPVTDEVAKVNEGSFVAVAGKDLVLDAARMLQISDTGAAQIVDARAAARFTGEAKEPREGLRSGHIPGARNLPWNELVSEDGTFRSPEDILARFSAAGLDPQKPIVASCGSGVTACSLVFGLHLAGVEGAGIYDGSWVEWGGREDLPIETGPAVP